MDLYTAKVKINILQEVLTMKGKKSKEKRYFCDWYKKYFLGVEDEVYVDGEWIFTPVSEKY